MHVVAFLFWLLVAAILLIVGRRRAVAVRPKGTLARWSFGVGLAGVGCLTAVFATLGHDSDRLLLLGIPTSSSEIWMIDADKRGTIRLAESHFSAYGLVWSPDGRRLAYLLSRAGGDELWVAGADGAQRTRLATRLWLPFVSCGQYSTGVKWSRDGSYISFSMAGALYRVDLNGHCESRPLRWPHGLRSPDGRMVALVAREEPQTDISVVNVDGSGMRNLTGDTWGQKEEDRNVGGRAWSPDSRKIAFWRSVTFRSEKQTKYSQGIYVVDVRSRKLTALTKRVGLFHNDSQHQWSPDGGSILFLRELASGGQAVCVVKSDGTDLRTLMTGSFGSFTDVVWLLGGQRIAFRRCDYESDGIYLANADGTGRRKIVEGDISSIGEPAWSTDARKVAFVRSKTELLWPILAGLSCYLFGPLAVVLGATSLRKEQARVIAGLGIAFGALPTLYLIRGATFVLRLMFGGGI